MAIDTFSGKETRRVSMPKKGGKEGGPRARAKGNKHARGARFQDDDEIEKRNALVSAQEEDEEEEGEGEEQEEEDISGESSDEEEQERKPKGPAALIETSNLNRDGPKKENLKVTDAAATAKPELSRRERLFYISIFIYCSRFLGLVYCKALITPYREELEKERRRKNYLKAYEQGKTPEARADLARLQKIRAEREAAAKRKEDEVKGLYPSFPCDFF